MLEIKDLHIVADGKEIIRGVSLRIQKGRIVALMGPNGSGKSSLVNGIMGHPHYAITQGHILLHDKDITHMPPHEKARNGIFLSMQHAPALPGITVSSFLRNACSALTGKTLPVLSFQNMLEIEMKKLGIDIEMAGRHVNEGFSGGEKKRLDALQLVLFKPQFALLDETDAGLDIDALKIVAETIKQASAVMGILLITHYTRILNYLTPDEVHVLQDGIITRSGGKELAEEIEKQGYKNER
ncbi:MAG: Fe-S cluster assembly ATPase SufC [Candidatus Ryanbacteria bacterium RIFCSPHIGHO2_02_FULL_45_17b]|uniref:Fe-S cluster assembly ATPase SufC n=1 Tax=Candidatus Ryanbacteria bacterium RIFCSPHIGHO2_01_FULL_45_22 TaxID=1802114 RepID=A0A1G2G2B3_9BACT|nr:MAG: Fe-S cluster assembly ATPase SufC [Candidatus Ryanbacteria bacterium RIFCSPHIGHO2_01_FULL_45_22]OGZ47115.1 MAG: Fe-S cluster assembly ATPase SufC [Candidatus Ryanbacteria bacterium RIFCSPHIGHO2_02_FULL_45_17b]